MPKVPAAEMQPKAPSSSGEGVGGGGYPTKTLTARARTMRNNPTEPEQRLRIALRDSTNSAGRTSSGGGLSIFSAPLGGW
jgi:hypothetical protein